MLIQFVYQNPVVGDEVDLPARNLDDHPGSEPVPVSVTYLSPDPVGADQEVWFLLDLPQCPDIGWSIYPPEDSGLRILTVHEVYVGSDPVGPVYQCFCQPYPLRVCGNCEFWQTIQKDDPDGVCNRIGTHFSDAANGTAKIHAFREKEDGAILSSDDGEEWSNEDFVFSLRTQRFFGCSLWR